MAYRAAPHPDSLTIPLDGFDLRIARTSFRDRARVTVLQSDRVVAVGSASREQLAAVIDAVSARRGAMAKGATP